MRNFFKSVIEYLRNHIKDYYIEAILNSVFIIFFTVLPFIIGCLYYLSTGPNINWVSLYSSGEFYLYSTALISSSYLIYYKNKVKEADLRSFFSIVSLILIVLSSSLYAMNIKNQAPYLPFLEIASISFLFISIPLCIYSQFIYCKPSPNIGEKRRDEQKKILKGLE